MLISTLRNTVLYNVISIRSIIIWCLSTVKIRFNVTSTLVLIALMNVWSRTQIRVWPVFLAAVLATQLELMTALLKLLRLSVCERNTLYNLFIIKSQLFSSQQASLQHLKVSVTFISSSPQGVLSTTHCELSASLDKEYLSQKQSHLIDLVKSAHTSQSIVQHLYSVCEPTGTASPPLSALLVTLSTLNLSSHLQKTSIISSQDDTVTSATAYK